MSKEIIEQIVTRANQDDKFMRHLLENAEIALKDYPLEQREIDFFKKIDEKCLRGLKSSCFHLADR